MSPDPFLRDTQSCMMLRTEPVVFKGYRVRGDLGCIMLHVAAHHHPDRLQFVATY